MFGMVLLSFFKIQERLMAICIQHTVSENYWTLYIVVRCWTLFRSHIFGVNWTLKRKHAYLHLHASNKHSFVAHLESSAGILWCFPKSRLTFSRPVKTVKTNSDGSFHTHPLHIIYLKVLSDMQFPEMKAYCCFTFCFLI